MKKVLKERDTHISETSCSSLCTYILFWPSVLLIRIVIWKHFMYKIAFRFDVSMASVRPGCIITIFFLFLDLLPVLLKSLIATKWLNFLRLILKIRIILYVGSLPHFFNVFCFLGVTIVCTFREKLTTHLLQIFNWLHWLTWIWLWKALFLIRMCRGCGCIFLFLIFFNSSLMYR